MSSPFVAAVVRSYVVFESKATLAKGRDLTADAAGRGARLVAKAHNVDLSSTAK